MTTHITCPSCRHEFPAETAIADSLRQSIAQEIQAAADEAARQKDEQIASLQRERELAIAREQQAAKKLSEQEKSIRDEYERKTNDQNKALREEYERKTAQNQSSYNEALAELKRKEQSVEAELRGKLKAELDRLKAEVERERQDQTLELEKSRATLRAEVEQQIQARYLNQLKEEREKLSLDADLKIRELNMRLQEQADLIGEMKRKAEQGSMQLQGEAAELYLEEMLRATFPHDQILPVGKGFTGADSIQEVYNDQQRLCGKIIYETKRTKHFSEEWLDKLKTDGRAAGGDYFVLVTEAMPKDITRFTLIDGVWVCSFAEVKSVAMVLRAGILKVGELTQSQVNKESKIQALYDYMTTPQFRGNFEGIVDAVVRMQEELAREKRVQSKIWAERDKQIEKVITCAASMYGHIRSISGAMEPIKALEHDEKLLEE